MSIDTLKPSDESASLYRNPLMKRIADQSIKTQHDGNQNFASDQKVGEAISEAAHDSDLKNADYPPLMERLRHHPELLVMAAALAGLLGLSLK